jgi:hypothetical protein
MFHEVSIGADCSPSARQPMSRRHPPAAATFTDGEYSKICGGRAELEEHARRLGGAAQPCALCL